MRKAMILASLLVFAAGCATNPYTGERRASRTVTSGAGGAAAGAAAGAILGQVIAGKAGKGAAVGAVIGAATGIGIGAYQDRQQEKLRQRLAASGVSVTRDGNNIILNMPSDITFDVDQSDVKPGFYETLNSVALVLKEFDKTTISVNGHADSTGSDQHNLALSQRRALSVSQYLSGQGVSGARLHAAGYGESRPIASNATPDGRRQNRRVEIIIDPVESQFPSQ